LHSRMKAYGGFEGNAQTIRILTKLEKYYRGEGIRPTRRLLLGVLKYPVAYSEYGARAHGEKPPKCFYDDDKELIEKALSIFPAHDVVDFRSLGPAGKNLDCSIMELADDIAYGVHDLEDGIARGILNRSEIEGSIRSGFKIAGVTKIREVSIDGLVEKLFSTDSCERKHGISLSVGYFIPATEVKPQNIFDNPRSTVTPWSTKLQGLSSIISRKRSRSTTSSSAGKCRRWNSKAKRLLKICLTHSRRSLWPLLAKQL